jgi:hypothetical protein
MKNIHILPTDKPTRLFTSDSELTLAGYPKTTFKTGKNIYITNDEKPKLNDWFLDTIDKVVFKVTYEDILTTQLDGLPSNFKKIILTTDQDLIKDGVQAIDDDFLEWFVKNPSCEFVEVELKDGWCLEKAKTIPNSFYKIIIPKEEPKQDWYCPKCKSYVSSESVTFEETHQLCNTSVIIQEAKQKNDYTALLQLVGTKQETLEEAFEKWSDEIKSYTKYDVLRFGAKWQQEQAKEMENEQQGYSKEEVIDILMSMPVDSHTNIIEWFEQFKKK